MALVRMQRALSAEYKRACGAFGSVWALIWRIGYRRGEGRGGKAWLSPRELLSLGAWVQNSLPSLLGNHDPKQKPRPGSRPAIPTIS